MSSVRSTFPTKGRKSNGIATKEFDTWYRVTKHTYVSIIKDKL